MKAGINLFIVVVVSGFLTLHGFGGAVASGSLKASDPEPPDGAGGVISPLFRWVAGDTAKWHDVYFGTKATPGAAEYRGRQPLAWNMYFHIAGLVEGTTYYWRIDQVEADGTTIHTGDVWSFSTAPLTAYNPDPPDGAEDVATDSDLSWSKGAGAVTHDVYFGTDATAVANGTGGTFKGNQSDTTYDPGTLAMGTTYYWRVDEVEKNITIKHTGDVWSFTTILPDLVELAITGPDAVYEQSSAQYNAAAYYDDGSTKDVTAKAIWSVHSPDCASIDANGLLTTEDVDEFEVITIYAVYTEGGITVYAQKAVLCVPIIVGVEILYVDADAVGSNDGSTWADAYNFLQDALAVAECGNEIWVAEGIYRPDEDTANPDGTGDRTATFQLKSCVAIYGGYAGFGEPVPDARDVEVYETILSGDFAGNDVELGVYDPVTMWNEPNRAENSYHVVTGSGTDESAVLDGFTITGGNANIESSGNDRGGGMYNDTGSPTVGHCRFIQNIGASYGGGMYNYNSSPTIAWTEFGGNWSGHGGGMFNYDGSSPTITGCVFEGNSAGDKGGGMYNHKYHYGLPYGTPSEPIIMNCVFVDNWASNYGGGIVDWHNGNGLAILINCTLTGNSTDGSGGGVYSQANVELSNCILWSNSAGGGTIESAQVQGGSIVVNYSCIQGWTGALGGIGNHGLNPVFIDPGSGNYRLSAGSDCIDAGDNAAVPPGLTTDLDSNPRIVDGDSDGEAVVDMGAYENMVMFVETCHAVNVGVTSATLCGRIIYDGGEACRYRFRYRKEGDADSFTPWSSYFKAAGESFSQDVSGLTPSSHYYFFAQIMNSTGASAGGLKSFTTLGVLLQLEAPNGGTFSAGSRCLICWKADPVLRDRSVLIEYSTDNGNSWNTIGTVANGDEWRSYKGGYYLWQTPAVNSDQCLVRISDTSDPSIFDVSDSRFSIVAQAVPDVVGLGQADAESAITAAGLVVGTITYIYDDATPAGEVMDQHPAAGTPAAVGSGVELTISAGPFATGPPAVDTEYAINIGAGGAVVRGEITDDGGGCCQYRFWYHEEGGDHYDVTPWSSEFKTAGESFSQDIDGLTPGTKYYFWAQVKNSEGESDRWARSESFTTLEGLLQLVRPNGGIFSAGSRCLICWKADAAVSEVLVEYSTDNGSSWSVIDTVANQDAWRSYRGGYRSWQAPAVSSDECLVRISDTSDPSVFDVSESTFSIVQ